VCVYICFRVNSNNLIKVMPSILNINYFVVSYLYYLVFRIYMFTKSTIKIIEIILLNRLKGIFIYTRGIHINCLVVLTLP